MRDIVILANKNTDFCVSIEPELIKYDDLRVFLLEQVVCLNVSSQILDLLCNIEKVVKTDDDLQQIYTGNHDFLPFDKRIAAQKYRALSQAAWLHVLGRNKLSVFQIKQVLSVMHERIIPNFNRPHLLMDFLVDAYDHGGAISLLALNALFVLIQHFQLDYPQFFTKLYELLEDGSLLSSSHRARFLRLLDLFLTSTHLPATITASIIKRLARLCLFAPPGAIVAILPFVYNQLKRHPTCMIMIHRVSANQDENLIGTDPFDFYEKNPLNTHAIDSSLWELQTLTMHYHPNVASIAKIFSQPFKKPSYQLEHFLSHSYETLYTTEHNRKRDREPGLEFEAFNVFSELDWTLN
jgi:U3 small nucleolar RNA-associated protein 19